MSFHKILSDLRVAINMDTMWFQVLENVCFEPLLWLGSIHDLVEICYYMCWLLWNISLLRRLRNHLFLDTFYILQHDVSSC